MPRLPRVSIHTRMTGRNTADAERPSSPLELLFDLTFVVAVAQVAAQLARTISEGTVLSDGLISYLMTFFAIWWAWVNFTWFASAYDTDDVPYRLLTMLQMGGVLVLAAGVPSAFETGNFLAITIGYVIMRVALVAQWLRAGYESRQLKATPYRYAAGIIVVQLGWVARLFLPATVGFWSFFVLAALELLVPVWAERTGLTPWHASHVAERYGLFTIILLGECVSAATIAVQGAITAHGVNARLLVVAISGLVLLFALWWVYFMERPGDGLDKRLSGAFLWGYGHYFVFAAIAALGAGLEAAVEGHAPPVVIGYGVAIPVAAFYLALFAVNTLLRIPLATPAGVSIGAAVLVLLVPLAAPSLGVAAVVAAIAFIAAAVTAISIVAAMRPAPDLPK